VITVISSLVGVVSASMLSIAFSFLVIAFYPQSLAAIRLTVFVRLVFRKWSVLLLVLFRLFVVSCSH
jgi:hypothetical protein